MKAYSAAAMAAAWLGMVVVVAPAPASAPKVHRGGAAPAATRPAGGGEITPATQPVVKIGLAGVIEYAPPRDWIPATGSMTETRGAYIAPGGAGMMTIEVLKPDANFYPGMAAAISKQLREMRTSKQQKILMPPTVEPDKRFGLRMHEKFLPGNDPDRPAEQLHLYRMVGGRLIMTTVNAVTSDSEKARAILAQGEAVALSATPVAKPPRKKTRR